MEIGRGRKEEEKIGKREDKEDSAEKDRDGQKYGGNGAGLAGERK